MRIIDKYKDYYDSAQCYSFCDQSEKVFVRKTKVLEGHGFTSIFKQPYIKGARVELIGFCGELYPVIVMTDSIRKRNDELGIPNLYSCFYSVDTYISFLKTKFARKEKEKAISYRGLSTAYMIEANSYKTFLKNVDIPKIKRTINRLVENKQKLKDIFLKYKTPYFHAKGHSYSNAHGNKITLLPRLSDYEFYKCMDPRTAYQELEMYFGSVLVENKEVPQIVDDKVLAEAKGFDRVTSFRGSYQKRKRKKNGR